MTSLDRVASPRVDWLLATTYRSMKFICGFLVCSLVALIQYYILLFVLVAARCDVPFLCLSLAGK